MSKSVVIEMPYIGQCLSVNHAYVNNPYTGQRVLKAESQQWRDVLACQIRAADRSFEPPVDVILNCIFKDKRNGCDPDNLSKIIMDSAEDGLGINDRDLRFKAGKVIYDKEAEPTLTIILKEGNDD